MASIPDLRDDHEITLEHCYILIEHLGKAFDILEGYPDGAFQEIVDNLNPQILKEFYDQTFEPAAFSRLFATPMGKGVLVGTFAFELLKRDQSGLG